MPLEVVWCSSGLTCLLACLLRLWEVFCGELETVDGNLHVVAIELELYLPVSVSFRQYLFI
ncbi:hypothetical protein BAUCODRAFT_30205 [Baudoinia panamericana UAMH 10762]|uniref:Uncharacterized protein n=1 Tax=Baudoinia panamericana (strain UAMH 10762) TaxID=717646 RepID=M2NK40_BAUPA|nr:uncharacterized protein BAUCODRAFT_30205 [Baudoinia panamericana UAMH 10762]EMC99799.1 hypothetical protein BAUCODRAFT_30205 [Baudoinia panamericana UAMH 10762]